MRKWDKEDEIMLKKLVNSEKYYSYPEIAKIMNKPVWGVQVKGYRLGIRKDKTKFRHTPLVKEKIRIAHLGDKHPLWKGDNISIYEFHKWIRRNNPEPKFCERCNRKPPYDLAKKEGRKYTRNIDDYEWLCRKCHMIEDGRLEEFIKRGGVMRIDRLDENLARKEVIQIIDGEVNILDGDTLARKETIEVE
jgi:hypothetical protein